MKTLAISLHRLGDLIMHAHVLHALKQHQPNDIVLLTHPFFRSIDFLFPFIQEAKIFERFHCQQMMGENYLNKSWAFRHIDSLLQQLNNENFDRLIDLSQTETSSRWVTFLQAPKKIGVAYSRDLKSKSFCDDNQYVRYLHSQPRSAYHFIDLFKLSLSLPLGNLPEAAQPSSREKIIVLQTQSSDVKKNWPLSSWKSLFESLTRDFSSYQIIILSSPAEYSHLKSTFAGPFNNGSVICTNMKESYELLKRSCLLITLDTAMKHLATWTQTPIIEIAVGSSSPFETGAYQKNGLVLKAQTPCYPCSHSSPCSQTTYRCHSEIDVSQLLAAVRWKLFGHRDEQLGSVFRVDQSVHGLWSLQPTLINNEETYARRHQAPTQNHY